MVSFFRLFAFCSNGIEDSRYDGLQQESEMFVYTIKASLYIRNKSTLITRIISVDCEDEEVAARMEMEG